MQSFNIIIIINSIEFLLYNLRVKRNTFCFKYYLIKLWIEHIII